MDVLGEGRRVVMAFRITGCGGRGTGAAAQALKADSNVELWAMGDAFPEPIERSLNAVKGAVKDDKKFNVTSERKFVGVDAFTQAQSHGLGCGGDVYPSQ